jgi:hypothetical protein
MRRKVLLFFLLLVILAGRCFGQDNDNDKAFVGISFGPSLPVGNYASTAGGYAKTGFQIDVATAGYKFADNFGICANWYGAANAIGNSGGYWGYGGVAAGPMIALPAGPVEFDLRPMVSFSDALYAPSDGDPSSTVFALGFDIGATVRYNISRRIALLLNADYISSKPTFSFNDGTPGFQQQMSAVGVTFGIAFRFGAN